MAGGKRRGDAGYGQGQVSIAGDDVLDEEELCDQLLATMASPQYQPPTLPRVAMELMRLANQPDVTVDEVAKLLERDTLLTGRVMTLVQSAVYVGSSKITSIKEGLVRIGLRALRDIVIDASMRVRVFRSQAYSGAMERLQRHSAMTAHVSRIICRHTKNDAEYSFLCGLLHDVGIAGSLICLGQAARGKSAPQLVAVWPAIERAHAEAGARMAELWGLPEEVQTALRAHHQVLVGGEANPLAATVCVADDMAHEMGFGLLPGAGKDDDVEADADDRAAMNDALACERSLITLDRSRPKTLEQAQATLGLTADQLAEIRGEAESLSDEI